MIGAVADVGGHFLADLDEAELEGLDRVAVGAAVVGGDDLVGLDIDEAGLRRGRAAVDAEDVLAARAHGPGLLLEVLDLGQASRSGHRAGRSGSRCERRSFVAAGEGRARFAREDRRAEGLEVGGFLGDDEIDLGRESR